MSDIHKPVKGSCLCGAIQYQVDKIESQMGHCHCTMCRKFHGAAYSTFGEAKQENFKWLKGKNDLKSFQASNGSVRQFCKNCGSSMTFAVTALITECVEFSLGTLDEDIEHHPDAHIFVDSKANWTDISDDLPCYKKGRVT